jgi:hypothetical protein
VDEEMKKLPVLIGIAGALFLAGVGGSLYVLHCTQQTQIARIYQDDTLVQEIDLAQVKEPYTLTVSGEDGAENVVLVEPGAISMESASCPDGLCVNQGKLTDGILPIVCLPNHVRIVIAGTEEESVDAVVG